uniref:RNA-directed DNA polymerase n=1 Tax=Romanomermis culicivorax TaxID=13658 RepID=A0A915I820_ROMCU
MTAFNELKSLLRNDLQLTIFDPDPPTILSSDAYNIDLAVDKGLLLKADQTVLPSKLHRQLMNKAHEGHPGIIIAKIKLCEMYWWPSITMEIEETIHHCQGCQDSAKSNPRSTIPTDPLPLLKASWEKTVINITRPFATALYQN